MHSNIVIKAKKYIEQLLKNLIDKGYYFHNLEHTLSVFQRASYLAKMEGINEELREIVELSALFHDTGFLQQYDDNEIIGAKLAETWLEEQKYPEDKIDIVKQIILATKLGSPTLTKLEEIIKDADMDNLGRNDFFTLEVALRNELKNIKNIDFTDTERYKRISSYIQNFNFFTETQRKERNKKLEENKKILLQKIIT